MYFCIILMNVMRLAYIRVFSLTSCGHEALIFIREIRADLLMVDLSSNMSGKFSMSWSATGTIEVDVSILLSSDKSGVEYVPIIIYSKKRSDDLVVSLWKVEICSRPSSTTQ